MRCRVKKLHKNSARVTAVELEDGTVLEGERYFLQPVFVRLMICWMKVKGHRVSPGNFHLLKLY